MTDIFKPAPDEVANTFKPRTVVFIILGLIIPVWIITLPLFWYFAYKSYIAGELQEQPSSGLPPSLKVVEEIETLHTLFINGALSEAEFQAQKARLLGTAARPNSLKVADEIEAFHQLTINGALSEAEFQKHKARLLGPATKANSSSTLDEIEALHKLYTNGVLSEPEFQAQKTRLLAKATTSRNGML
ncbi:MAG: SHOCT domain-containing protein [Pseudomonadales bacterium]|jgi:hypothetical protein|nr:SHOCT domain-containing protein [Pseudomonadales bacterium]